MEARSFRIKKYQILLPVAIGICVITWMFIKEFDPRSFKNVRFDLSSVLYILAAFLLLIVRDSCMITRFHLLAENELTWRQTVKVNFLREFSTAIMPSTVGAGGLVILFFNREGINTGKSTAITIVNLFLDNTFFVLLCPALFGFIPLNELFNQTSVVSGTIGAIFWIVFPLLTIWTILLYIGIFHRPDFICGLFKPFFYLPFLKRFRKNMDAFCAHLIEASEEFKNKKASYWIKLFLLTIGVWTSRFFVVNVLFMAFTHLDRPMVIFGRQLILWLAMVVSPTPGGSGLSEITFSEFYNDVNIGSGPLLIIIAIWRILFYYIYLLAGIVITPGWLKNLKKKT